MELSESNVKNVYNKCKYMFGERRIFGLKTFTTFSIEKTYRYKKDIVNMLSQLPDKFVNGNGMSYADLYFDNNGKRWTWNIDVIDMIISLGLMICALKLEPTRDQWMLMPERLPYAISLTKY